MVKLGASGKFPQGRLNESDEGELTLGLARDPKTGLVHLRFGKPVAWLAMSPEDAITLALGILKHAAGKTDH